MKPKFLEDAPAKASEVRGAPDADVVLVHLTESDDSLLTTGSVFTGLNEGLHTNLLLQGLFETPEGSLWVGSEADLVFTTAPGPFRDPLAWQRARHRWRFDGLPWKVTGLPQLGDVRMPGIISAVWGTSDANMYFGTVRGYVVRWDGTAMSVVWFPSMPSLWPVPFASITHIGGRAPNDVWVLCDSAVILHYDGIIWRLVPWPRDAHPMGVPTGIAFGQDGRAWVCTRQGELLAGTSEGLKLVGRHESALWGVAFRAERLILASGESGVSEWRNRGFHSVRSNFMTTGLFQGRDGTLFFVEPEQPTRASYIQWPPGDHAPFQRIGL